MSRVRRRKRRWLVGVGCVLVLLAIAAATIPSHWDAAGKLQITVLDQRIVKDHLQVSVLVSNAGPRVLVYSGNGGNCDVRYQVESAWATNSFPDFGTTVYWLLPGASRSQRFELPGRVSRFQVGYEFELASRREAVLCRLYKYRWAREHEGLLEHVLVLVPSHPGGWTEFWDDEHQVLP